MEMWGRIRRCSRAKSCRCIKFQGASGYPATRCAKGYGSPMPRWFRRSGTSEALAPQVDPVSRGAVASAEGRRLSNQPLMSMDERGVTFRWKDSCVKNAMLETMTLDVGEFARRIMLHVLPTGFHPIQHYELLANGSRAAKLTLAAPSCYSCSMCACG